MTALEEEKLLERLQRGELRALDQLIDRYGSYVSAVAGNIIGAAMTVQDVEEVVSDVFFDLWRQAKQVRPGHLKGFLSHLARNKAVNKLRERKRELALEEDVLAQAPGVPGPEENLTRLEQARAVRLALDGMGEPDREIFLRHYYYCQTVSAIGLEMGMNPSTVKSRLSRGRDKLKAILLEGGYQYEDQ